MAQYNFDLKLTTTKGRQLAVDTAALYGYWERLDGSEGGGMWFARVQQQGGTFGPLDLVDYDGAAAFPKDAAECLRAHGLTVDEEFN